MTDRFRRGFRSGVFLAIWTLGGAATTAAELASPASASRAADVEAPFPAPPPLRTKATPSAGFLTKYLAASARYRVRDFAGARELLDSADSILPNQAESYHLRGLIALANRDINEAEKAFHRAMIADPALWVARLDHAELPFLYRNFALARARYERLLSELNPRSQQREGELLQFKVFLTYLLEGREETARSYLLRFRSPAITPARFYALASLAYYAGEVRKAAQWTAQARASAAAEVDAVFANALARVGWITDSPNRGVFVAPVPPDLALTSSPSFLVLALANPSNPAPLRARPVPPVPSPRVSPPPPPAGSVPGGVRKPVRVSPAVKPATDQTTEPRPSGLR